MPREERRTEDSKEERKVSIYLCVIVLLVGVVVVMGIVAVGRAMNASPAISGGVDRVLSDVAEAIAPEEPEAPTGRIIQWVDAPDKCINPDGCASSQFTERMTTDGKPIWICTVCGDMSYCAYKARILIGITEGVISFGPPLPSRIRVLPKPVEPKAPSEAPSEAKPEAKKKR